MTRLVFSDFRDPSAGQAYEIAWDYLARSGAILDEFEACVFLAQRITIMVDGGDVNKIRLANKAISDYHHYICQCETVRKDAIRRANC